MALRRNGEVSLTVEAAVIDRYVGGLDAYRDVVARVRSLVEDHAAAILDKPVSVRVNEADDYGSESVDVTTTVADEGAVSDAVEAELGSLDALRSDLLAGWTDVF